MNKSQGPDYRKAPCYRLYESLHSYLHNVYETTGIKMETIKIDRQVYNEISAKEFDYFGVPVENRNPPDCFSYPGLRIEPDVN